MRVTPGTMFRFGDFTLDTEKGELNRLGARVPLQDKPLQLLALLLEKPGQMVTREEIRQRLWGTDTFVEFDDSLNHAVRKLREALGDSAGAPKFLKTLPRQGYRFLAPVAAECEDHCVEAGQAAPAVAGSSGTRRFLIAAGILLILTAALSLTALVRTKEPAMPSSLLVLPFRSLDSRTQDDRLGEGISEQVTARLMSLQGLQLVSPETAYRVSSSGTSPAEAGRRLKTEAVLIGSYRIVERRIRVNTQMIRSADSRILWADGGFEIEAQNLLEAERVLSAAIATRLRGALTSRERMAMAHTPTSNVEAYELFVRGKLATRRGKSERNVAEQLFEQAIRLDPAFADALAGLAFTQAGRFLASEGGNDVRRVSIANARKALAIDPSVTMARRALITIYHSTGQAEEGLKEAAILRKANPLDAETLSAIGTAYYRAGMPDRAIPLYQRAVELDPDEPTGMLAFAAYWTGQYELGLTVFKSRAPKFAILPGLNLAAATGQRELARSIAAAMARDPEATATTLSVSALIMRNIGEEGFIRPLLPERIAEFERQAASFKNERLQIGLALIYAFLGDQRSARNSVRLALEINPDDPWTLFYAAEVHAQLGDEPQAIDYLQRSMAHGFLALFYLDWPHGRLYQMRAHPEVRELRDDLVSRIAVLRKQY